MLSSSGPCSDRGGGRKKEARAGVREAGRSRAGGRRAGGVGASEVGVGWIESESE